MMKIVEEPRVQAGGSQFFLYGIDWRHNLPAQDAVFILHVALRARAPRDGDPGLSAQASGLRNLLFAGDVQRCVFVH